MLKKVVDRWRAETPRLWRYVRNASAMVGAVSTAILTAETAVGVDISDGFKKLLAWGVAVGAGMASIAQLHKKNDDG